MKIKSLSIFLCAFIWLGGFVSNAWAQARDLDEVISRGQIRVALYKEFSPFSDDGKGVDVELAKLLAARLGVKLEILWFDADEKVDDDMRNMVWKGTVLGYGPADVMLHVPIDQTYTARNSNVLFFAPYYREKFAIARNVEKIEKLDTMDPIRNTRIGVEIETYPDTVLLSADSGAYRSSIVHFKSGSEAVEALKKGDVSAVMAMQSELEAGLAGTTGFEISEVPLPLVSRRQWVIGMAVKAGHDKLAQELQKAVNSLAEKGELAGVFKRHGVAYRAP